MLTWVYRMTFDQVAHLVPHLPRYELDTEELQRAFSAGIPAAAAAIPLPPPPAALARVPRAPRVKRRKREETVLQEIQGSKSLLLEILRRASYDWVLYRTSRRKLNRDLAESAYRWLFLEGPQTVEGRERRKSGKHMTSFLSICELLDLDANAVRRRIRELTPKNIRSVGRPAEYRRRDGFPTSSGESNLALPDGMDRDLPDDDFPD